MNNAVARVAAVCMDSAQNDITAISQRRPWETDPTPLQRIAARVGLQGKLLLSFMLLIAVALGASCAVFLTQSRARLADMIGEQARQMATALALASGDDVSAHRWTELQSVAHDLIKGRNILYVACMDVDGVVRALGTRDPDFKPSLPNAESGGMGALMQVKKLHSRTFGEHMQVVAPVFADRDTGRSQLVGYMTVGMSQLSDQVQMSHVNVMVIGVGCAITIMSLPLAYIVVRRIFGPIHELVGATRRIIGGNLDTRVATHRGDVIGDLARSFNEMVNWVKKQQVDVAAANQKLVESNRDLESRIEQRTGQLETANRRLSSEIAEKEDFLRAVSHDLNAPLRNIAGMATMLLMKHRDKFEEDVVHRLERIKSNVDIETDLISELLELSRIKTRRQKMETVDLEAVVWELRGMFENDLRSKGIELIVDTPLPPIDCERARIRQVLQNLVDNAIKYMGDGIVRQIHIGCIMRVTEAEFYVRDTGMGIEADELDKVFYIFRRGKSTSIQNISGKGVGLASVKSIIETYSGKIWVESTIGEGSTFKFTINGQYLLTSRHRPEETSRPKAA